MGILLEWGIFRTKQGEKEAVLLGEAAFIRHKGLSAKKGFLALSINLLCLPNQDSIHTEPSG